MQRAVTQPHQAPGQHKDASYSADALIAAAQFFLRIHSLHPRSYASLWQCTNDLFCISGDKPPDKRKHTLCLPSLGCQHMRSRRDCQQLPKATKSHLSFPQGEL